MTSAADRYRESGVDLAAAERAKERIAGAVASTRTDLTLGKIGAFGGMFRLPADVEDPAVVVSTDGVGTKVLVAIMAGVHDTIGCDLVNHCVNDILVHGARPVAFQDYLAAHTLETETTAAIVEGVARACRAHTMVLSGGETAQLPDLYSEGHYDLAGTIIGVVAAAAAIHGESVLPGHRLIGYRASGLHTNGYTLARKVVFGDMGLSLDAPFPGDGRTVAEVLLEVHRSYAAAIAGVTDMIAGLAHITGGGIAGNLSRTLPAGCGAVVESGAWEVPNVFRVIEEGGKISRAEMYEVFNMGIGMIAVVPDDRVEGVCSHAAAAGVETQVIGEVVEGSAVTVD